jgi:hypothetical protein
VLQLLQGRSVIRVLGLGISLALAVACLAALACGAGAARSSPPPVEPTEPTEPTEDETTEVPPGDPHVRIEELDRDISAALARAQVRPPVPTCSSGTCAAAMSEPFSTPAIDPACHPRPSSHPCGEVCTLSRSICRNQERICRIAQRLPDNWAANKCIRARASCDAAHEACCSCMQQRRGPPIPL